MRGEGKLKMERTAEKACLTADSTYPPEKKPLHRDRDSLVKCVRSCGSPAASKGDAEEGSWLCRKAARKTIYAAVGGRILMVVEGFRCSTDGEGTKSHIRKLSTAPTIQICILHVQYVHMALYRCVLRALSIPASCRNTPSQYTCSHYGSWSPMHASSRYKTLLFA